MSVKKTMEELERKSIKQFQAAEKIPIVIVLDEVRSMHNVGSVFRTADAFLVEHIYLCGLTPTPPHRDIQKTALGATETVSWSHHAQTSEVILMLHEQGYQILAIEQAHGSISLLQKSDEYTDKLALVFGHEVYGVKEDILLLCDETIEIPQLGSKHSLNISVTAGIVVYNFAKQYLTKSIGK